MATTGQWVAGARLRTLPAAAAGVVAGTGAAITSGGARPLEAVLALVVALALQVGVNYANDYSDGIRGTDTDRVGPLRLVGSGVASPGVVKRAALASLAVAGLAGLVLAAVTTWWLLAIGAAAMLAAWGYTGGPRPYGYAGLGEVFVFIFFGPVAVCGTTYVQARHVTAASVCCGVLMGLLISALLVANNLRDVPTDRESGKMTLAVRIGERRSRWLYAALVAAAYAVVAGLGAAVSPWLLLGFAGLPAAVRGVRPVLTGAAGRALIPVLAATGSTTLICSVGLLAGFALAG